MTERCVASPLFFIKVAWGPLMGIKYCHFGVSVNGIIIVPFEWPEKEVSATKMKLLFI